VPPIYEGACNCAKKANDYEEGIIVIKMMPRDIEAMGWILEQKCMSVEQVERVFWKGISEKSIEAYRRLKELQKAGFLRRTQTSVYRKVLYCVTGGGLRQLKVFGRDRGLSEGSGVHYFSFTHDMAVTDLRILFREWGYADWASERILSLYKDLRRIPDGMVYRSGKRYAVEYESTQKSKKRYEDIFIEYELERKIENVIYVVDTPILLSRLVDIASSYVKILFVQFKDLEEQQVNCRLTSAKAQMSLSELLEGGGASL
jgi:hypothetical protein